MIIRFTTEVYYRFSTRCYFTRDNEGKSSQKGRGGQRSVLLSLFLFLWVVKRKINELKGQKLSIRSWTKSFTLYMRSSELHPVNNAQSALLTTHGTKIKDSSGEVRRK